MQLWEVTGDSCSLVPEPKHDMLVLLLTCDPASTSHTGLLLAVPSGASRSATGIPYRAATTSMGFGLLKACEAEALTGLPPTPVAC